MEGPPQITREAYDAVLFDLDGVLTATAKLHAAAWKRMFDEFLRKRAKRLKEPFNPFDIDADYHRYVDGKPRYDGVRSFLESREIDLPQGEPLDEPGFNTVCALGNRKDQLVNEIMAREGVETYSASIDLIRRLRPEGMKIGVVSSSRNCSAVLRAAGIEGLFDLRIDGEIAAKKSLAGKPAPDTFLAAAKELGVDPKRAVVVEDAIAGVEAGRAGGFGLIIGIARRGQIKELKEAGADVVVTDLFELSN